MSKFDIENEKVLRSVEEVMRKRKKAETNKKTRFGRTIVFSLSLLVIVVSLVSISFASQITSKGTEFDFGEIIEGKDSCDCEFMIKECWDDRALDWNSSIGTGGNIDRKYQSDPAIYKYLGDPSGKVILDQGCGNGYFAIEMKKRGAKEVHGVDISDRMIEIAKDLGETEGVDVGFHVGDCAKMESFKDESVDTIVSSFVLMYFVDIEEAMENAFRVLKKGGEAIIVILHPCFPLKTMKFIPGEKSNSYRFLWYDSYLESRLERFSYGEGADHHELVIYQRPLTEYFSAFFKAGFTILNFEEPQLTEEGYENLDQNMIDQMTLVSFAIIFHLKKPE